MGFDPRRRLRQRCVRGPLVPRRRRGVGRGWRGQGDDAAGLIEAILLEEAVQGHAGNGHAPGAADEVEQVPAGRLGLFAEELGDRAGEARQELAVGASGEAMVGGLNDLLGRKALLGGGGGATEVEQARQLGHLESGLGVEQDMTEQTAGKVVVAALLEEAPGSLEDSPLGGGQGVVGNGAVLQPAGKGQRVCRHGGLSVAAGDRDRIQRRSWKVTQKARKTVWC